MCSDEIKDAAKDSLIAVGKALDSVGDAIVNITQGLAGGALAQGDIGADGMSGSVLFCPAGTYVASPESCVPNPTPPPPPN